MKAVFEPSKEESAYPARYWRTMDDGRLECRLCPRFCHLKDGQRGFCFVRKNMKHQMVLTTYGRSSGFCLDPIEKKPLNHFYPGSAVLSFGTAGCNLGCKFCQNWDISKSRSMDRLAAHAMPEDIAHTAFQMNSTSVAFTYNDPVIFAEYAIDTAKACREKGIKTVAVSAGYITEEAREDFFQYIDAANIDLKAFTNTFYKKLCFAELEPVLDTLKWLHLETSVWFEITTLLIPGQNDRDQEIRCLSEWVVSELGPDRPLHFTAFHPDFKMNDLARTASSTLQRAREIARSVGVRYVYTGNVHDLDGGSTWCPGCGEILIERDWFQLGAYRITSEGYCQSCGFEVAGRFDHKGSWHGGRTPVRPLKA